MKEVGCRGTGAEDYRLALLSVNLSDALWTKV